MKVAIGCDHAGYDLKEKIIKKYNQFKFIDCGAYDLESVDYPDFARSISKSLKKREVEFGVLICGTGIGISIAANRYKHIRAALVHDTSTAKLSRQHNDANVIVFGGRLVNFNIAKDSLDIFLRTDFDGGRHQKRLDKLS